MNWDAVGSIGELVAATGALAALVYLAMQIGQNSRAVQTSTHQAVTQTLSDWTALIGSNPEVAELWFKGRTDFGALSKVEAMRFGALLNSILRTIEFAYCQGEAGALPRDIWRGMEAALAAPLMHAGCREAWRLMRFRYQPEFAEWVDSACAQYEGPD